MTGWGRVTWARRLIGLAVILLALCVASSAEAKAKRGRSRKAAKKLVVQAKGPPTLELESIDLAQAQASVLVGGVAREPDARFFAFHDDRDRHFIADKASCAPIRIGEGKQAKEMIRCLLDLPRFYLGRGHILAMTMHVRGREVEADAKDVAEKFTKAGALLPAVTAPLIPPLPVEAPVDAGLAPPLDASPSAG